MPFHAPRKCCAATKDMAAQSASSILSEARKKGASKAYLQVVKGNTYAKTLYTSLGFQDLYPYWFRVKASLPQSDFDLTNRKSAVQSFRQAHILTARY